jgi:hypothetical protein
LLLIEKRGGRFIDVSQKEKRQSANKPVQATAGVRRGSIDRAGPAVPDLIRYTSPLWSHSRST